MSDLEILRAELAKLPLGETVTVRIGAAWEGQIRVVDLLQLQPLQVLSFQTTSAVNVRLWPEISKDESADKKIKVGVLPNGTRIDVLPGANVDFARVVLWVSRDFIRGM